MFLGHFGVALAAKKAARKASLGTLVLAAQLADLLWPIFLLFGWEQVRIAPGNTRVTPLEFTSYPYSHSLVAQLLWGLAIGIVYFAFRRDARSALVLAVIVPSHWVLDYVAHRPDMPILPDGARYGLGMWNSLPLTCAGGLVHYFLDHGEEQLCRPNHSSGGGTEAHQRRVLTPWCGVRSTRAC